MSHTTATERLERPQRNKRQTQKAQEILDAGESVPGLPSSDTPPKLISPNLNGSHATFRSSTSASIGKMLGTNFEGRSRNAGRIPLPTFAADKFLIYNWEVPRPKSFVDLSESRKEWKRRVDQQEKSQDFDDGSDDWYEFCGIPETYKDHRKDGFAMEYCIARTWVKRAKRAFWANKSWQEFEVHERTLNSQAQARAESDPEKSAVMLKYTLDNNLRMAVFHLLKIRLCEEIWLRPYRLSGAVLRLSTPRSDSKMPTPTPDFDLLDEQARRAPTVEEMMRGITGWSIDRYGIEQPLYDDETEPPSGMRNFMRDMREQAQLEPNTGDQQTEIGHMRRGHIGDFDNGRIIPMTAVEEISRRDPDFETSKDDED